MRRKRWSNEVWRRAFLDFPRWDCAIETAAGSAKPGRGGRRKRKAERAKIRARIGSGVERKRWPLTWTMRRLIDVPRLRVRPLSIQQIAALMSNPIILPPGLEIQFLEPRRHPGRRERRRRAKLRRRRARAIAERRRWVEWAEASSPYLRNLDRPPTMLTPGA